MHLTYNQRTWLKNNRENQVLVDQFLAAGAPSTGMTINSKTLDLAFVPKLRGVHVVGKTSETEEEAIAQAEAYKERLIKDTADHAPLDERALGIEGRTVEFMEQCDTGCFRTGPIHFIGSTIAACTHDSNLADIFDELLEQPMDQSPSVQPLVDVLVTLENDRLVDRSLFFDTALELLTDEGLFGFLMDVMAPVRLYDKAGDTHFSSSWGRYHTGWVYGETIEEVMQAATKWAEWCAEYDRSKA